jgi:hypothetical protein
MDLKRKLARLRHQAPPAETPAPDAPTVEAPTPDPLHARVKEGLATRRSPSRAELSDAPEVPDDEPGFVPHEGGFTAVRTYELAHTHGVVPLGGALEGSAEALARLALDASLTDFDPRRALYLDTETTGLAGGTGTIPFLLGVGSFEGDHFVVTQHLVAEPGCEGPMLTFLAERLAACGCVVSFNGKSFDLPLLRTRFAMSLMPAPPERPHLDLLHVARRIYRARVEQCRLTTLERDVLGFAREDDIAGADVPALYQRFLREGRVSLLTSVARHNRWDLLALVALVAELSARAEGAAAKGRFEPEDLLGVARTTWRAGDHRRALELADALSGHPTLARDAHLLAADAHRGQNDPRARVARLHEALALCPDDGALHLELARCYERDLDDAERALQHAELARGAEDSSKLARRISRLRRRAKAQRAERAQLSLPGVG